MAQGHKIEREVDIKDYLSMIKGRHELSITTTNHTFFRLNERQRKIFKESSIKDILLRQVPLMVGIQYNRNYAAFYRLNGGIMRFILDIASHEIKVVAFYVIEELPRIP